jgi:serine phosphatase RsbU (regulator of sigma subunit)
LNGLTDGQGRNPTLRVEAIISRALAHGPTASASPPTFVPDNEALDQDGRTHCGGETGGPGEAQVLGTVPTSERRYFAVVVLRGRAWSEELTGSAEQPEGRAAFDRIADLVSRLLGSEVGLVSLVGADRQFFLGQHGLSEPWRNTRQTPLSQSICHMVVTSGAAVEIEDTATDPRTRSHEARTVLEVGSYLGVPLLDDNGDPIGSLCAIDRYPRHWSSTDRNLLTELSAAARSEMRARVAVSVAERATDRVQVLADASEVLSRTLEIEASLDAMLEIIIPSLASACVIYLPASAGEPRRVLLRRDQSKTSAELNHDPEHVNEILDSETVRSVLAGRGAYHPMRTTMRSGSAPGAGRELLVVPLTSRQEVLGVLVFEPRHELARFDELDVTVLADLGRRAAATLRNARAFGHEREMSLRLQHDLLFDVPDIEGLDVCATYEPAADGAEVGGDWYDVAVTPNETVIVTLGDVTGHDMRAAAAMGRLSAAIRCYGHDGLSPTEILGRLDGFSSHLLGDGVFATGICLEMRRDDESSGWNLELTNAGHPPPLLVPKTGDPRLLEAPLHPPIGFGHPDRTAGRAHLGEGDILVLYSDGLIEHRREHLGTSMERLLDIARSLDRGGPIDDFCHKLIVGAGPAREDDIALLVLRPSVL